MRQTRRFGFQRRRTGSVIRLLMTLVITDDQLTIGLDIMEEAMDEY